MAVLPSGMHQQSHQGPLELPQDNITNQSNQYIFVNRTGIVQTESPAPRASSAPPSQNQVSYRVKCNKYKSSKQLFLTTKKREKLLAFETHTQLS